MRRRAEVGPIRGLPRGSSGLQKSAVVRHVGVHERRVEGEDDAHDDDVARHHEQAPHQHADGVGEGHEDPELFAAGKDHDDAGDELGRADERQEELGFQDGHHKGLRLGFRVAGGHDGGVAPVDVVQVFGSGAHEDEGVQVAERGVESGIHGAQVLQNDL